MIVETVTIGLIFLAWKNSSQKGVWTPERREMYEAALKELKDPEKLRKLAEHMERAGFPVEANVLRRRADLRAADPAKKEERRQVYEKAMKSTNIAAILRIADMFEAMTATGSAKQLREHARDVQSGVFQAQQAAIANKANQKKQPEQQPSAAQKETSASPEPVKATPEPEPEKVEAVAEVVSEIPKDALNGSTPHVDTKEDEQDTQVA